MFRSICYIGCLTVILLLQGLCVQASDMAGTRALTLRDAVSEALQNNLNLQLRKEDSAIAEGAIDIARSRFDKQLTAQLGIESAESTPLVPASGDQEDKGVIGASLAKRFTTGTEVELGLSGNRYDSNADGLLLNPSYTSGIELGISQPLLRGWGQDMQLAPVSAAEKDLEATIFQVDSLAADLAASVKNAYWNLVFAWQDIEVKQLSVTLAQKLLEETKAKITAGKLAPVELYQPQSEVARREEDLIAAERAIGVADDDLKLLLNSSDWLQSFNPVDLPQTTPVELQPATILDMAITNRPDLKAAKRGVDAARLREKVARDDLRPSLNVFGSLGYGSTSNEYSEAIDSITDDPDTSWKVGLNISLPLDNSAAKGALQQARASHSKARTNLQLLQLDIKKAVRTTVRDVQLAIKAMEATRKTSLATRKRLEAEQAKFDAGKSTTLDVLIAQDAYSQALSQENLTNILYAQALAELDRIQGLVTFSSSHQ